MRIAISTPGLSPGADVYTSSGSEVRWALNWKYLLEQQGHQVVQVHDTFSSTETFDLYFHTTRHADVSCDSGNVLSKKHVHLAFGIPHQDYVNSFACGPSGQSVLAFPHRELFEKALPSQKKYNYRAVFLPTPYPESLLPQPPSLGFERIEMTWLLKRVWQHSPNTAHEFKLDSYVDLGIWTLEAIRDLSLRHELVFNYARENDYGTGTSSIPHDATRVLESIVGLNYLEGVDFRGVLDCMSRSKLSFSIGGLTGSVLESAFCGCVPLAYTNPVSYNEHYIVPLTLTETASSRGLTLPLPQDTTKSDIKDLLERLWLDRDVYEHARNAFEQEFSVHSSRYALRKFEEML